MSSNYLAYMTPTRRQILDILNEWRALEIKELKLMVNYNKSEHGFRKILRSLKDKNLITSKKLGSTGKVFYFINKSFHYMISEDVEPLQEEFLYHDILTSKFLMSFVRKYKVERAKIFPISEDGFFLTPDAELKVKFDSGIKNIAIEVELTRKSIKRYTSKFNVYNNSNRYDLVLYVFNDQGVFNSYKNRLDSEFKNLKNCKIILILNSTLNLEGICLDQTRLYGFGEDLELEDIFELKDEN